MPLWSVFNSDLYLGSLFLFMGRPKMEVFDNISLSLHGTMETVLLSDRQLPCQSVSFSPWILIVLVLLCYFVPSMWKPSICIIVRCAWKYWTNHVSLWCSEYTHLLPVTSFGEQVFKIQILACIKIRGKRSTQALHGWKTEHKKTRADVCYVF